ncbi:MAG: hypothetical protein HKM93_08125 [Desulfobacteraceae bacterium]|nr:hypothetical protein [Desulfobacteraceae bacterium]
MNKKDESLAELLAAVANQYRDQINDAELKPNMTRMEIIRKLELINQSIKNLIKHEQLHLF